MTNIEWTDKTWNPVTGCSKVSSGCAHCYAEVMADRFWGKRNFTDVLCHEDRLEIPLRWRKPRRVFVNSMSDLFHEKVPDEFIDKVFMVMAGCPEHTFQILTKRANRMLAYMSRSGIPATSAIHGLKLVASIRPGMKMDQFASPAIIRGGQWNLPNVWLGVSVENQETADERIPILLQTPAAVRCLSVEPLLGPVKLKLAGIHWVIVGGESGSNARPMNPEWVRSIRDQCAAAGVPFFFKQWGGPNKKKTGRLLDGREHNDYPDRNQ